MFLVELFKKSDEILYAFLVHAEVPLNKAGNWLVPKGSSTSRGPLRTDKLDTAAMYKVCSDS